MTWEEEMLPERSERFSARTNVAHVPYLFQRYRKAKVASAYTQLCLAGTNYAIDSRQSERRVDQRRVAGLPA